MIWHSTRDPDGNLRYHQEHTKPLEHEQSALPKSRQFEDTGRTLGIQSRGFHFTGRSTASDGHDDGIHSDSSLLYDNRHDNESFVESRNGAQANPAFKTDGAIFQTTGPVPQGKEFTPSTAAAPAQGGTGPNWWERILNNARNGTNTQSTNLPAKPPEKFQIGLRSSNVKPKKEDQKNGVGPMGVASATVTGLNGF